MESSDLRIRRMHEAEAFDITDVKITNIVPELPHSLPSTLNFEEYENFRDLPYPTIDRNRCDMLIGMCWLLVENV